MEALTFNKSGTKATTQTTLNEKVFGVKVTNHDLLSQAYITHLANGRANLSTTKTRGQVRGGGKKPWRQKGTGRARVGSSRVPHWRGGGVAFGPSGKENYSMNFPVKAKRAALRQALSLAAAADKIRVIASYDGMDGKVKNTVSLLKKINASGKILVVVSQKSADIDRSTSNVSEISVLSAKYLTVFHLLNADTVIFSLDALESVSKWLEDSTRSVPVQEGKQ